MMDMTFYLYLFCICAWWKQIVF